MELKEEFITFLKDYNIVALAVAFVMGVASTALVNSLVKDIFMPLITLLLPSETWAEATFTVGDATIRYGAFLAELLNFLILAFIIFIIIRKLLRLSKTK
ncbi:MAG: large conductance mechanosensitive channel protein MscL [Candidatus Paceibacterota bacterium]